MLSDFIKTTQNKVITSVVTGVVLILSATTWFVTTNKAGVGTASAPLKSTLGTVITQMPTASATIPLSNNATLAELPTPDVKGVQNTLVQTSAPTNVPRPVSTATEIVAVPQPPDTPTPPPPTATAIPVEPSSTPTTEPPTSTPTIDAKAEYLDKMQSYVALSIDLANSVKQHIDHAYQDWQSTGNYADDSFYSDIVTADELKSKVEDYSNSVPGYSICERSLTDGLSGYRAISIGQTWETIYVLSGTDYTVESTVETVFSTARNLIPQYDSNLTGAEKCFK